MEGSVIARIARLSRISLSDQEKDQLHWGNVLHFIAQLEAIEIKDLAVQAQDPSSLTLRSDQASPGVSLGVALENAPEKGPDMFRVPKMVGA